MVILSLASKIFQSVLTFLKTARSARAGKLLKLTKLNRIFKMFKAFRTIRIINFIYIGAETFNQVRRLIEKMISCLPLSNSPL